jgi:hypothetical protein
MEKEILRHAICITLVSLLLVACGNEGEPLISSTEIFAGRTYLLCDSGEETSYRFGAEREGIKTIQNYSDNNCISPVGVPLVEAFTYTLGSTLMANDGLDAQKFNLTISGNTLFTLIRLSGGPSDMNNLFFGDTIISSAGRDGSATNRRHDGVDLTKIYLLQP